MHKPVTPALHGIIDYVFSGILLYGPYVAGLNDKATKSYNAIGASFLVGNAFTDTPVGIQPVLSFKDHQKTDAVFLAGLSLLTVANFIRKDKKAFSFHVAFLTTAIAHYILTDYNASAQKQKIGATSTLKSKTGNNMSF